MDTVELLTPVWVSPGPHDAPAVAAPDLDARWAAWVARGREHERRVRRRIALCVGTVGALALGAFTIYALLKP